jgi:type IV pilus assembly protein PilW
MGLSSAEADALTCLPHHKSGTPAIVVRRLDTVAVAPNDAVAGQVYVQASRCSSSTARFTHATAVTGSPDNFPLQNNDCITPAQVRRYISRVYFIASCSDCGSDTLPTLKRAELGGNQMSVTALVEGIDDIAFEFGFDTAKAGEITQFDGIPDEYRSALSATLGANNNDWKNVVAVRSYLLTRALETSAGYTSNKTFSMGLAGTRGPFSDGFKRRLYSMTSRLNNVAGLREGS